MPTTITTRFNAGKVDIKAVTVTECVLEVPISQSIHDLTIARLDSLGRPKVIKSSEMSDLHTLVNNEISRGSRVTQYNSGIPQLIVEAIFVNENYVRRDNADRPSEPYRYWYEQKTD